VAADEAARVDDALIGGPCQAPPEPKEMRTPPMADGPAPPLSPRWYYRPWPLLFLLFVVLGPFGLPLLWKSPAVSRTTKIVLTIAVIVYTAMLAETAVVAIRMMIEQLELASQGCHARCAATILHLERSVVGS